MKHIFIPLFALLLSTCGNSKVNVSGDSNAADNVKPAGPTFSADSAYQYLCQQCDFGPRTMNSPAHDRCANWIANMFQRFGMKVNLQRADLRGYDGTILKSTNIIAAYRPEHRPRTHLCPLG